MSIQKTRRISVVSLNAVGDNSVVAAVTGTASPEGRILNPARKLRIISGLLTAAAAGNLNFASGLAGAKTNLSGPIALAINEKLTINPMPDWEFGPMETKAGEDLNLFTSAAMGLSGWLVICEVV